MLSWRKITTFVTDVVCFDRQLLHCPEAYSNKQHSLYVNHEKKSINKTPSETSKTVTSNFPADKFVLMLTDTLALGCHWWGWFPIQLKIVCTNETVEPLIVSFSNCGYSLLKILKGLTPSLVRNLITMHCQWNNDPFLTHCATERSDTCTKNPGDIKDQHQVLTSDHYPLKFIL